MKITLPIFCIILLIGVFSVSAQGTPAPSTPIATSTPDLVGTLAAQGTEISALATRTTIDVEQAELHASQGDLNLATGSIVVLASATVLAIIGGWYGWKSGNDVKRHVEKYTNQIKLNTEEKLHATLDESFFRSDARTRIIYVPNTPDFTANVGRLTALGFKRLREYSPADFSTLGNLQDGAIVVYPAKNLQDVTDLEGLIDANKLSWSHMGFIIYTLAKIDGANQITEKYPTAILVNSSATLITNLYALARILL